MVRTFEHGNEPWGYIKKEKFFNSLATLRFFTVISLQKVYLIFKTIKSLVTCWYLGKIM